MHKHLRLQQVWPPECKQFPLERLKNLSNWLIAIRSGRTRLLISHKGEPLCFLIKFEQDSEELKSIENPVVESISFTEFKALDYQSIKALLKADLVKINYKGVPRILVVPERFIAHLYLNVIA